MNDGASWTSRERVSTASTNVHDTDLFRRQDGNVDMYYSYPDSAFGFSLWRKCLKPDGTTGQEEKVVDSSWGSVVKPRGHRLSNGSIVLTFVDQSHGHLLHFSTIWGDAPCDL